MNNQFEAKGIIIDLFDKSPLNQTQINETIKELIEYYNLENFISKKYTNVLCDDCKESSIIKMKFVNTCEFCKQDI